MRMMVGSSGAVLKIKSPRWFGTQFQLKEMGINHDIISIPSDSFTLVNTELNEK
jgi:hypothetical protein